jgi:hypothetical protein
MVGVTDTSEQLSAGLTTEEHELGMNRDITRRDFLNTAALGTGAALQDWLSLIRSCQAINTGERRQWRASEPPSRCSRALIVLW